MNSTRDLHRQTMLPIVMDNISPGCSHVQPDMRSVRISPVASSPVNSSSTYLAGFLPTTEMSPSCDQHECSTTIPQNTNVHPMRARAKSGIFKPRIFALALDEKEPLTIAEALPRQQLLKLSIVHYWQIILGISCPYLQVVGRLAITGLLSLKDMLMGLL